MHKRNMIVAMDEKRVIGKDGKLPSWRLKSDIDHFVKTTIAGKIVVMGRKTFESIPNKFKPLPNRLNIILSKNKQYKVQLHSCLVLNSIDHFLQIFGNMKFYVIGGGEIYKAFFPYVSRLVVTHVRTQIDGDTFFPKIDDEWRSHTLLEHEIDEKNQYPFKIVEYTRRPRL